MWRPALYFLADTEPVYTMDDHLAKTYVTKCGLSKGHLDNQGFVHYARCGLGFTILKGCSAIRLGPDDFYEPPRARPSEVPLGYVHQKCTCGAPNGSALVADPHAWCGEGRLKAVPYTNLPSSVYLRCRCVAFLDVLLSAPRVPACGCGSSLPPGVPGRRLGRPS